MVLYFTGTGNSLYVAKKLDDVRFSIPKIIKNENQHTEYRDTSRCQMCLACIQHCPENAIRLTIPEKNPNARYHNSKIRLSEIVEANNQNEY